MTPDAAAPAHDWADPAACGGIFGAGRRSAPARSIWSTRRARTAPGSFTPSRSKTRSTRSLLRDPPRRKRRARLSPDARAGFPDRLREGRGRQIMPDARQARANLTSDNPVQVDNYRRSCSRRSRPRLERIRAGHRSSSEQRPTDSAAALVREGIATRRQQRIARSRGRDARRRGAAVRLRTADRRPQPDARRVDDRRRLRAA